jgi:hypothetical protein
MNRKISRILMLAANFLVLGFSDIVIFQTTQIALDGLNYIQKLRE